MMLKIVCGGPLIVQEVRVLSYLRSSRTRLHYLYNETRGS